MKKHLFILSAACSCLIFCCSCGQSAPSEEPTRLSVSTASNSAEVDVDLTQISDTVRFAELYNITLDPKSHEGKTIRMSGQFREFPYLEGGQTYYAVVVQDAGACCIQGLEVVLDEESTASYPENDSMVTVEGTLETYESGTIVYSRLRVNEFQINESGS